MTRITYGFILGSKLMISSDFNPYYSKNIIIITV